MSQRISRKRTKLAITTIFAAALVLGAAAPAMALSTQMDGGYTGKSFLCNGGDLCVFTLDQTGTGNHTVSVQGRSSTTLVGPKVTATTGGLASIDEGESYYLPGGKHWGPGVTFTS